MTRTVLSICSAFVLAAQGIAAPVDFVEDVRPILQKHCCACHGDETQRSGLRLDIGSEAFKGGELYGESIIPGKADDSPLIHFVRDEDADLIMPPDGERLSVEEIATLSRWIDEGADWPAQADTAKLVDRRDHWSFKPVQSVPVPTVNENDWPRNEMDRFVLARLEQEGLQPAPEAGRVQWLRRVSFDLIGLPPTPEQVEAFVNDQRSDAYQRVVERLLSSPRYGERWAQHWLDVVRYADTHGFEVNTERPNAWPYRDYVIASFNNDTPYDQFIREQIVGDLLDKDAATGFLVTASVLLPGQIGKDPPSIRLARQDALDEIVNNIGQTFLGMSVGCARCHDHKFDAISQRDYYEMQAFVAGVEYQDRELMTPEIAAQRRQAKQSKARLAELESFTVSTESLSKDQAEEAKALIQEKTALAAQIKKASESQKVFAGKFRKPDEIRVLGRGSPEMPKDEIAPAVLDAVGDIELAKDADEQTRRKTLADWIADPKNPLTPRVMVNRIWQAHFGAGLVKTPNDFGRNGVRPSHPELLDWLSAAFIESGWSVKQMHRQIVLSATYRQASRSSKEGIAKDADARLLWRYPLRRLMGEVIRDSILAINGQLNLKTGGPGYNLFDRRGGLSGFKPRASFDGDGLRRMIYAHKVRREPDAIFGAFDCPDGGQSRPRRRESTTPIQALNLFNSRFVIEQADALAERVEAEAGDGTTQQIQRAYQLVLSRQPTADEVADVQPVVADHGLATLCRVLFNGNEFLFIP